MALCPECVCACVCGWVGGVAGIEEGCASVLISWRHTMSIIFL